MLLTNKNKSIIVLNFLLNFNYCNASANILANIGKKFTTLENCLIIANLFSDTTSSSETDSQHVPQGKDQLPFWGDFLSHLISINAESAWIIENEDGGKSGNFKTVFSPDIAKSPQDFINAPKISVLNDARNFNLLSRGFSRCALTVFLNYISSEKVRQKRIFAEERNPFVLKGTISWATVLIVSFEPPYFWGHGIPKDVKGGGRVFFLHCVQILEGKHASEGRGKFKNVLARKRPFDKLASSFGNVTRIEHSRLGYEEYKTDGGFKKLGQFKKIGEFKENREYENVVEFEKFRGPDKLTNPQKFSNIKKYDRLQDIKEIKKLVHFERITHTVFNFARFRGSGHYKLYFFCQFCPPVHFLRIRESLLILSALNPATRKLIPHPVNVFVFRRHWNYVEVKFHTIAELELSSDLGLQDRSVVKYCAGPMKLKKSYGCPINSRKVAVLSTLLNITVAPLNEEVWWRNWGDVRFTEYLVDPLGDTLNRMSYQFELG